MQPSRKAQKPPDLLLNEQAWWSQVPGAFWPLVLLTRHKDTEEQEQLSKLQKVSGTHESKTS